MINDALRQYLNRFVIVYLNDIIIYLNILKKHVNYVFKVLECLDKKNLYLKLKKCEFHQEEVDFLEFVVRQHEVRMNLKKLRAIKEWKSSINVKEVQSFLGFMNYNKKFIKNYFVNAISLTNLTKKDTPWTWGLAKEKSFQDLKLECLKKLVLKMYDLRLSSRIEIDASNLVIDAYFSQEHEGMWHSMTYLSRKLSLAKQNYDVHDKELLAIVFFLKS